MSETPSAEKDALDYETALRAGLITTCREWPDSETDRCNEPAEFVLWGKLFPADALGPRCWNHAVEHTGHSMPYRVDQWAVIDLRPIRARITSPGADRGASDA